MIGFHPCKGRLHGRLDRGELLQLAGILRWRALLEWTLLPDSDRFNVKSGMEALHNRLEGNGCPRLLALCTDGDGGVS